MNANKKPISNADLNRNFREIEKADQATVTKLKAGNKAIAKPKPQPKCSFLDKVGSWFSDRGKDIGNFAGDVWNGISSRAGSFWNGLKSGTEKLLNDPGAFFGDMWNSVVSTITSPRFWVQAGTTALLAMATGGQSLWVQAVVMGTGYTVSGEGYDYANVGFDLDKFFAMKGVDNPGEYLGGVIFDAAKDSGMMFGGMKLNEWLKGRKATGNSGSGTKLEIPKYETSKLQHEFKHASDFGVNGNWNSANGEAFKNALNHHVSTADTILQSTYRGSNVIVYINKATGNGAYYDLSGNFIGGWKFSAEQLQFHIKNGVPLK